MAGIEGVDPPSPTNALHAVEGVHAGLKRLK
jgi:hypothetical protein